MSDGPPSRPSALPLAMLDVSSFATSHAALARSDATAPTAMQLALIPYRPHSAAVTRVNICSPAFAALYPAPLRTPVTPAPEETFTITPLRAAIMCWPASRVQRKGPVIFRPTTASHALDDMVSSGLIRVPPALFT